MNGDNPGPEIVINVTGGADPYAAVQQVEHEYRYWSRGHLPPDVLEYVIECIKVRPVAANDLAKQRLALRALAYLDPPA